MLKYTSNETVKLSYTGIGDCFRFFAMHAKSPQRAQYHLRQRSKHCQSGSVGLEKEKTETVLENIVQQADLNCLYVALG